MTTPSGPITLTPGQFAKTPAGAKPGATYQSYLKFVNARRAANPPPAPDPYNAIIAGLPKPETDQQISSQAQGEISPIVAAIVAAITKQTQGATSAISGYSNDAANKLAAINYGQPYQQAEGAQATVDSALASSLAGQGSSDAQSLQQRLAVINDPSVAAAAANVSGNATGAANADTAQGTAALTNLIANAAAANSYGQKQPGIERTAGLQDIANVQATANNNIATGTQDAEQQLPSILQNLQQENDNRSSAIASAQQNQLARNDNIVAGQAANTVKIQTVNANNATKVQIAQLNAAGKVTAEQLAQARSDRTYALQFAKTYGYNPATGEIAAGFAKQGGRIVKVGTGAGAGGVKPPTSAEVTKEIQTWHDGTVKNARVPAVGSDGKPVYDSNGARVYTTESGTSGTLSYTQALKRLTASGVPQPQALKYLDSAWKRGEGGEGGRSWLTNDEQAALKGDGMPAKAKIVNGHGVLTNWQVATLKRAGKLPAGQETSDGFYVIEQTY